jgi:hypothetical protein
MLILIPSRPSVPVEALLGMGVQRRTAANSGVHWVDFTGDDWR